MNAMKFQLHRQCGWFVTGLALMLQACAVGRMTENNVNTSVPATSASDSLATAKHLIPQDFFKKAAIQPKTLMANSSPVVANIGHVGGIKPMVWLYESPTAKVYSQTAGIDFKTQMRVWEMFLKKYRLPYKTIATVDVLENSVPGVVVLPSLVALTDREKKAIAKFRAKGGGVLATWLTGVRDGNGAWQGFSFMDDVLDTRVLGDTSGEEEVNFLITNGDGPITYNLPAGQRVWLERVKDIYPLRLQGQQSAASILDWSRNVFPDQFNSSIAFGEQLQTSGLLSRVVVLGYPERLWMSADPKIMEAIAHNSLLWLLRQNAVHLAAWPYPFASALSFTIESPEVVDDMDVRFAQWIEKVGGRATFYLITESLTRSLDALAKLQSKGHELAFMGNSFQVFKGDSEKEQVKRLMTMQRQMNESGLSMGADAGFIAPLHSLDQTTVDLLGQFGMGHYLASNDASDHLLPKSLAREADANSGVSELVLLTIALNAPEDLINEGDPDEGLKRFLAELDVYSTTGGLSVLRFPNQSILTDEQLKPIFDRLGQQAGSSWFALNSQVASWWRERSRVNVDLDVSTGVPKMVVTIVGSAPLNFSAAAIVNLPFAHDSLRLLPDGHTHRLSNFTALDPWRVSVSLAGLPPGTYRWLMNFDHAQSGMTNLILTQP